MKKIFCLLFLIASIFAFSYSSLAQTEEEIEVEHTMFNSPFWLMGDLNGIDIEIEEPTTEAVNFSEEEEVQYIAEGYFEAFKRAVKDNGKKNISVVLKNVKTVPPQVILPLLEQYCKDNGYELLQYNVSELQENGYIYNGLLNAVAVVFSNVVMEGRKLTISIVRCNSSMSYTCLQYILHKNNDGEWDVTERMIFHTPTF